MCQSQQENLNSISHSFSFYFQWFLNKSVPEMCSIKEIICWYFQLLSSFPFSLSLFFYSHLPVMEVCPPSRLFSCRDPSWAERGGNQRYTTSHSSLYFLANVGSPTSRPFTCPQSLQDPTSPFATSNSTAVFVLSSQTHTALDKCAWTPTLFEIS